MRAKEGERVKAREGERVKARERERESMREKEGPRAHDSVALLRKPLLASLSFGNDSF